MSESSSKCSEYDDEVFEEDSTEEQEEESPIHYEQMVSLTPKQNNVVEADESEESLSIATVSNLTEHVHSVVKDLSHTEESSEDDDEEKSENVEFAINSITPSFFAPEDYYFNTDYKLFSIYAQTDLGNCGNNSGKSYSFSNERMREIKRHNEILLDRIMAKKQEKSSFPVAKNIRPQTRISSAAINRKKQDIQIARENYILGKKIEAIARKHSQYR